uniref:DAGKc domain-containing protein n=1 Tax=Nothobranchius furzeri TaxID=105023 RepID=A0A8C6LNA9_NOTFU
MISQCHILESVCRDLFTSVWEVKHPSKTGQAESAESAVQHSLYLGLSTQHCITASSPFSTQQTNSSNKRSKWETSVVEHKNHARELVRKADLSQWDALVIMSGDGLLFEVINGLMEREDWKQAIQTPLGILPGGSGNALSASIHHYSQPQITSELLLSCGFIICKGLVGPLDLVSVHLASTQRLFSFLSLAWGFVADVDIESEKYRHVGAIRFLMGSINHPPSTTQHPSPEPKKDRKATALVDSLLPALDQPVPESWTVVKEEDFVLVLAIYQSHLAEDLWTVPEATADDGLIHLFYVTAGISRPALLRLFLAMEKGAHLACGCPHLVYEKVRALRLEPISPQGMITVDGEVVEYGPVQAQIHPGLARLICG